MSSFQITLDKVQDLIRQGRLKEADVILRPHCRFPGIKHREAIIELETRIVDGLIKLENDAYSARVAEFNKL